MKNVDDWQKLTPNTTSADAIFYQFCDALEVKDGQSADEDGWAWNRQSKVGARSGIAHTISRVNRISDLLMQSVNVL